MSRSSLAVIIYRGSVNGSVPLRQFGVSVNVPPDAGVIPNMGFSTKPRGRILRSGSLGLLIGLGAGAIFGVTAGAQTPQLPAPPPAQTALRCRIGGRVTSGDVPLPGVSVIVHVGDALKAATSTDLDGTYIILFAPNATYRVSADFTGFTSAER